MAKQDTVFKPLIDYPGNVLAGLLGQINQQQRMLAAIRRALPVSLAQNTAYALISDRHALIYAQTAAWATQLRFYMPVIKQAAEKFSGKPIESVQIRLIVDVAGSVGKRTTARIPTLPTIEAMQGDSLHVKDQNLRQTLQKLTATLKRLSDQ